VVRWIIECAGRAFVDGEMIASTAEMLVSALRDNWVLPESGEAASIDLPLSGITITCFS